jgi:imidazolonepropionase-like amidohydrolase
MTRSSSYLFRNLRLFDPREDELLEGMEVLVGGDRILEVSQRQIRSDAAEVIDCGGRTMMPGLIDAHVHVYFSEINLSALEHVPLSLLTARSVPLLRGMLDRGFTTVRDTGGADWGIKQAIEEGSIAGPRLFISGRAIGQTGGHSDMRRRTDNHDLCSCADAMRFTLAIADGVDEVRKTVREELRQGADAIKIMVSGGVASPFDPLDSLQFSAEEIAVAVREAADYSTYVLAHAYTPEAITRAVTHGVRTIEHGNLIDDASAALLSERGGFMVANLITYVAMKEHAQQLGMSPEKLAKNEMVIDGGFASLEICKRAGVEVGFGSDLLGPLQVHQSREFLLRQEVQTPLEILRSATLVGAKIVRREGLLGVIAPGAYADLLLVNGNPLQDLQLLQDQGAHLAAIMKAGKFHKAQL